MLSKNIHSGFIHTENINYEYTDWWILPWQSRRGGEKIKICCLFSYFHIVLYRFWEEKLLIFFFHYEIFFTQNDLNCVHMGNEKINYCVYFLRGWPYSAGPLKKRTFLRLPLDTPVNFEIWLYLTIQFFPIG